MIKNLLESDAYLPEALTVGGEEVRVALRRNHRARRYILRFKQPASVVATIPRGGSKRDAWAFILRSQSWIRRQLSKALANPPVWGEATEVWFRGEKLRIEICDGRAQLGPEIIPVTGDVKRSVIEHLQNLAFKELAERTRALAAETNTQIARVAVRNQRSRWGSCSLKRTISLNWRLIQAPVFVRDYIILHELMHLREMNHSARFWAEVESVCPEWREAERWIRKHGREVMSGSR